MIYAVVGLFIALAVSMFANVQMYRKVSYYEQWYEQFATNVKHMRQELYRMDRLGAYRSDDEVGYFFEALKKMSMQLFRMGFFEDEPSEPDPANQSAINVTTDQKFAAMEHEQQQQYHNSMGPPGSVDITPPPDTEQSG